MPKNPTPTKPQRLALTQMADGFMLKQDATLTGGWYIAMRSVGQRTADALIRNKWVREATRKWPLIEYTITPAGREALRAAPAVESGQLPAPTTRAGGKATRRPAPAPAIEPVKFPLRVITDDRRKDIAGVTDAMGEYLFTCPPRFVNAVVSAANKTNELADTLVLIANDLEIIEAWKLPTAQAAAIHRARKRIDTELEGLQKP